ncbi:unnamed protein product [Closterium sp. NIES-53]
MMASHNTFVESVCFYRLHRHASSPVPLPPLFVVPGSPPGDPLAPQGPAPSCVSQVDPPPLVEPLEVSSDTSGPAAGGDPAADDTATTRRSPRLENPPGFPPWLSLPPPQPVVVDSGAGGGGDTGGADSGGAGPGVPESRGAESGGDGSGGADSRGAASPGGGGVVGAPTGGRGLHDWVVRRGWVAGAWSTGAGGFGAGGAAGTGGAAAGGAPSAGGAGGAGGAGAACTGGTGVGGAGDPGTGGTGAIGAEGTGGAGAGVSRGTGGGGSHTVLSLLSSTGLTPHLLCPPPDQSQPQLQPSSPLLGSPLPAPSPYLEQTGSLAERREPESHPASPVRTVRRAHRPHPPPVPHTHTMALRPSSVPQRVALPSPPVSYLPDSPDPESDLAHAASPTITCLLATFVTDPSFESTAASALVTELVDFAATCCLNNVASLFTEYESVCPTYIGGELALGSDILEDRQFDLECLAIILPRLASMLLCPEGDPDATDIPTIRSSVCRQQCHDCLVLGAETGAQNEAQ